MMVLLCYFFFYKQKTAYELRISDWSSDVCSSDLRLGQRPQCLVRCPLRADADSDATRLSSSSPRSGPKGRIRGPCCGALGGRHRFRVRASPAPEMTSSEERRVGQECVSTGRSRWSTYP